MDATNPKHELQLALYDVRIVRQDLAPRRVEAIATGVDLCQQVLEPRRVEVDVLLDRERPRAEGPRPRGEAAPPGPRCVTSPGPRCEWNGPARESRSA